MLELGLDLADRVALALQVAGCEVRDPVVEPRDAGPCGGFGLELGLDLEQELRILVAALDPASISSGCCCSIPGLAGVGGWEQESARKASAASEVRMAAQCIRARMPALL